MNYFTEQSIELANQKDYLDQLFSVYPLSPDSIREIDSNIWNNIKQSYDNHDNIGLFDSLETDLHKTDTAFRNRRATFHLQTLLP